MPSHEPRPVLFAVRIESKTDRAGGTRNGWLLYSQTTHLVGFADEGDDGQAALERVARRTGGAVLELGPITVAVQEYQRYRTTLPPY